MATASSSLAARGGNHFVRFFFHATDPLGPKRQQALVALAYAAARDYGLDPIEVLVRSDLHNTTRIKGKFVKDPNGWHATISFKFPQHAKEDLHVTTHAYTAGQNDYTLQSAVHTREKADETLQGPRQIPAWPADTELEEYAPNPIAYSHLPEQGPASPPLETD